MYPLGMPKSNHAISPGPARIAINVEPLGSAMAATASGLRIFSPLSVVIPSVQWLCSSEFKVWGLRFTVYAAAV